MAAHRPRAAAEWDATHHRTLERKRRPSGIQIRALGNGKGKTAAQGQDAVHLLSLDEVSRRAVQALAERKIVDEVEHGAVRLVELEAPSRGSAIAWILKIAVFISAGFAISHCLAVRIC